MPCIIAEYHDRCICHLDQGSILLGEMLFTDFETVENAEWRTFPFRPIENGLPSTSFPPVTSILLHAFSCRQLESEIICTISSRVENDLLHALPCSHTESGVYIRAIDCFEGLSVVPSLVASLKAEYFVPSIHLLKAVCCMPSLPSLVAILKGRIYLPLNLSLLTYCWRML